MGACGLLTVSDVALGPWGRVGPSGRALRRRSTDRRTARARPLQ